MAHRDNAPGKEFGFELNRFIKALLYVGAVFVLGFFLFIVLACMRISSCAFFTYNSYNEIPAHKVGLLLGTAPNVAPGQPNDFFTNRIMAAASLYHKGKIEYILVSGDNRHESYNEPRMMMNALLKAGVPLDHIVADFAGFSTIDSVLRARYVFMLNDMIIISQDFHNERAIFIAKANGIDAIGFNASNPSSFIANFKVSVREFFARIKCVFDVYLLDSKPTYLGDPIAIGNVPLPKKATDKPKYITSKPKQPGYSVKGLEELALLRLQASAKQPTDSALILNQRRKAVEAFQQTLLKEDAESGDAPLHHVPMASPLDLPDTMTRSSAEELRRNSSHAADPENDDLSLTGTEVTEALEGAAAGAAAPAAPASPHEDAAEAEPFDPANELMDGPELPALEIPSEVPAHLAAPDVQGGAQSSSTAEPAAAAPAGTAQRAAEQSTAGQRAGQAQNSTVRQAQPEAAPQQAQPVQRRAPAPSRRAPVDDEPRQLFGDPWE